MHDGWCLICSRSRRIFRCWSSWTGECLLVTVLFSQLGFANPECARVVQSRPLIISMSWAAEVMNFLSTALNMEQRFKELKPVYLIVRRAFHPLAWSVLIRWRSQISRREENPSRIQKVRWDLLNEHWSDYKELNGNMTGCVCSSSAKTVFVLLHRPVTYSPFSTFPWQGTFGGNSI